MVDILSETGYHSLALRYAYDSLRAHFETEFAHGHYITQFMDLSEHCPELRLEGRATLGCAVCYREEFENTDHWAVIEDGPEPDLARDEFAPDSLVSKALVGHSVGEIVLLSASGIQPRSVTIRQICHKFIFRFEDCRDRYQFRFPGGTAFQMIHVGTDDEFDPTPIIKSLEERRAYVERLDEIYRSHPMPFSTYVRIAGRDEIEIWQYLVAKADLGIRCSMSDLREWRAAIDIAKESQTFVLDLTALLTLAGLDLLPLIQKSSRKCVVSQTVYEHIQSLVEQSEDARDSQNGFLFTEGGRLRRQEWSTDQRDRHSKFLVGLKNVDRVLK